LYSRWFWSISSSCIHMDFETFLQLYSRGFWNFPAVVFTLILELFDSCIHVDFETFLQLYSRGFWNFLTVEDPKKSHVNTTAAKSARNSKILTVIQQQQIGYLSNSPNLPKIPEKNPNNQLIIKESIHRLQVNYVGSVSV
jgi:hypothetical protein